MTINNYNDPFSNNLNVSLNSLIQKFSFAPSASDSIFNTNNMLGKSPMYNSNIITNSQNVNVSNGNSINQINSNPPPPGLAKIPPQFYRPPAGIPAQAYYKPVVQTKHSPILNSQSNNFLMGQIGQLLNILNGLRSSRPAPASMPRPMPQQRPMQPVPSPQQVPPRPPQMPSTNTLANRFQNMFNQMRMEIFNGLVRETYTQLNQHIQQEIYNKAANAAVNDFKGLVNNVNTAIKTIKTPPPPPPKEYNIAKEGRGEWGDPHYDVVAKNGKRIKFDHKGIDNNTYNIFSGDNLQIDGKYVPYKDPKNPQVVGTLNVKAGNDNIQFTKSGEMYLNGKALNYGQHKLQDGTTVHSYRNQMYITTPDTNSKVHIKAESSGITVDPEGDFHSLSGILGKTVMECRALTKEECEAFDVTHLRRID